jgi:histidinol dehydrogenase
MEIFNNPIPSEWEKLIKRPVVSAVSLEKSVKKILQQVKDKGDRAIKKYTAEFDGVKLKNAVVSEKEIRMAIKLVSPELKTAIETAAKNIRKFHLPQLKTEEPVETMPGIRCYRKSVGIEKVGLYIPGGTAPLFSTILMLGIPATIAGCKEIVLCSPPNKEGNLHPAILFAAKTVGIHKIFKVGGVQAIAAMAYGTESIPKVYKIFGPGNQYVTAAKQMVQQEGLAIDMPAGPSEVCVLADIQGDPSFIAADLLAQAEHGVDSQVMLVSTSESLIHTVLKQVDVLVANLPRKNIVLKALENSKAIIFDTMDIAIDFVNLYAPEHLIIACKSPADAAEKIINAGSVFLGNYTPESVGDYASGTNHTLPTNGFARAYSGVSVDSFVKKITFQELTPEGLRLLAPTVTQMARAEGLEAHAMAVEVRFK